MGIALLIAGLVVAFVLLDAVLLVYVFRRAARRRGGLVLSFGLRIGGDEQVSNVRRIPEQGTSVERADEPSDGADEACPESTQSRTRGRASSARMAIRCSARTRSV